MTSPPTRRRILFAFLVAPLAAPAAFVLGAVAVEAIGFDAMPSTRAVRDLAIGVFALGAPVAYAATIVAGAPTYLVLRRLGLVGRWTLWTGGAAIGAAVGLALAPHLRGDFFSVRFPWWAGALLGLASAEAFWQLVSGSHPGRLGQAPGVAR